MHTRLSPALASLAIFLLVSCAPRASLQPGDVAQASFSHSHDCPLERVRTELLENVPPAPAVVARDPARQAMWTYAHRGAPSQVVGGDGATPVLVRASGCEAASLYLCRAEGGLVSSRRRSRYELFFTVCTERSD